ncbi:MAG TPA: PilT/PilU family type 4a pilus ATPase [Phycisphaerae bacterium]|nr:PilT/PilU family type 4a pilus ATPase [Phycisphaerales bacterium]HRX86796.1 PilT/PilU family type 4a pilus ATPase [Phycisphaerae bacterium]
MEHTGGIVADTERIEAEADEAVVIDAADEASTEESGESRGKKLDKLFRAMEKMGASDLHLKAGTPPRVRVRGALKPMAMGKMSNEKIEALIFEIMNEDQCRKYAEHGSMDFAHQAEGGSRFRVNVFRQRGLTSMAARRIASEIMDYKQLHLPASLSKVADHHQGLVLVSGITGSGKSTTISAMIEQINRTRACHIVTLEDPIEFQYTDKKAFINQREIGLDVHDFHRALKYLMRQDPDVVLIGEMRDEETFSAALHAAESGHLVFGTVHASGVAGTITRVLELFPENARALVRSSLVFNLQGIICQKLLKTIRPDVPRVPCVEMCLVNATVRKFIAEGRDQELLGVVKSSYGEGMVDFNESLRRLVEEEYIDQATAYAAATNAEELKMKLKGINISGSGIAG